MKIIKTLRSALAVVAFIINIIFGLIVLACIAALVGGLTFLLSYIFGYLSAEFGYYGIISFVTFLTLICVATYGIIKDLSEAKK